MAEPRPIGDQGNTGRSPFEALYWFDSMDSESSHRLVDESIPLSSTDRGNGIDIEVKCYFQLLSNYFTYMWIGNFICMQCILGDSQASGVNPNSIKVTLFAYLLFAM